MAQKDKVKAGKVVKKKPPTPTSSASKKQSEIDDIFSSKPKRVSPSSSTAAATDSPNPNLTPKKTSSVKVVDATNAGKSTTAFPHNSSNKGSSNNNGRKQQHLPPKDDGFADSRGKSSKYTEDGLRVFYMDDLRIGEGEGDTELCPFDCNCCF
ncbi:hypothetical protein GGI11_000848 [Coemansia sp. RSA 2049]|nr:hypothetical protein H4217_005589 [Coemansia sp. RSA 1939]KAJ2524399.1 hypothetical protein GGI11_000848 [Coemansia sp. RSA 2049]KAJ2606950.1 hypothetical protein EV177_005820 [Coemansia sp. RSA 1804]